MKNTRRKSKWAYRAARFILHDTDNLPYLEWNSLEIQRLVRSTWAIPPAVNPSLDLASSTQTLCSTATPDLFDLCVFETTSLRHCLHGRGFQWTRFRHLETASKTIRPVYTKPNAFYRSCQRKKKNQDSELPQTTFETFLLPSSRSWWYFPKRNLDSRTNNKQYLTGFSRHTYEILKQTNLTKKR